MTGSELIADIKFKMKPEPFANLLCVFLLLIGWAAQAYLCIPFADWMGSTGLSVYSFCWFGWAAQASLYTFCWLDGQHRPLCIPFADWMSSTGLSASSTGVSSIGSDSSLENEAKLIGWNQSHQTPGVEFLHTNVCPHFYTRGWNRRVGNKARPAALQDQGYQPRF